MCVRWMGMRRWKLLCGGMSVGNRFSACTHFAERRNYGGGGGMEYMRVCVSVCSGQCRSLSSDKQVLCHNHTHPDAVRIQTRWWTCTWRCSPEWHDKWTSWLYRHQHRSSAKTTRNRQVLWPAVNVSGQELLGPQCGFIMLTVTVKPVDHYRLNGSPAGQTTTSPTTKWQRDVSWSYISRSWMKYSEWYQSTISLVMLPEIIIAPSVFI